jgi:hypothetical protein
LLGAADYNTTLDYGTTPAPAGTSLPNDDDDDDDEEEEEEEEAAAGARREGTTACERRRRPGVTQKALVVGSSLDPHLQASSPAPRHACRSPPHREGST